MKAPARTHTRRPRSAATVTVAELVTLYGGRTGDRPGGHPGGHPGGRTHQDAGRSPAATVPAQTISVAALLRREGCGPHTADRPLLPRGHSRPVEPAPEPPRRNMRKATVAAGALFAAGAVFGSSLVDNAVRERSQPESESLAVAPGVGGPGGPRETRRSFSVDDEGNSTPIPDVPLVSVVQLFAEALPPSAPGPLEAAEPFGGGFGEQAAARPDVFVIEDRPSPAAAETESPTVTTTPAPGPAAAIGALGDAAGSGDPGPVAVFALPGAATPELTAPEAFADVPVIGGARIPSITVSDRQVDAPAATSLAAEDAEGAAPAAALVTPDVTVGEAEAGLLRLSSTEVTVLDVTASAPQIAVSADAVPEVELPAVRLSRTELATPDVGLGSAEVSVPDIELPDVELPAVRLGGENSDPVADAGEVTVETVDEVTETVGETVEEVGETLAETRATVDDVAEVVTSPVRSLGREAVRALDQDADRDRDSGGDGEGDRAQDGAGDRGLGREREGDEENSDDGDGDGGEGDDGDPEG